MRQRRLYLWVASALVIALASVAIAAPRSRTRPAPAPAGTVTLYANTQTSRFGGQSMTQRGIAGYYFTMKTAPSGATAQMDVPATLGLASPVPWSIQNSSSVGGAGASQSVRYWGCSATIPKGQPEVQKGAGDTRGHATQVGSSGYPDPMKLLGITDASHVPGDYALHVSYLGDVKLTMTDAQEFLDPLVLTAPADGSVDTTKAIALSWNKVPRAIGYGAYASGKDASGRNVFWSCTRHVMNWRDIGVAGAVKDGRLLPADRTSCTIPAGIFSGPVTLSVTAYSSDVWGKGALRAIGWAQSVVSMQLGSQ